jgi:uncharacterized protein YjbI with pentapeptide repeats
VAAAHGESILDRLQGGGTLDGLARTPDGRIDARGITFRGGAASPMPGNPAFERIEGVIEIRGAVVRDIDFSRSKMKSFRFFDCTVSNCLFERATCTDWRLWRCTVERVSFESANLRDSVLGPVTDGGRNAFVDVDFSKADLRGSVHVSSDMTRCRFVDSRLLGVDFQGTVFRECVFKGVVEDVLFYRHAFGGEHLPPNEMHRVDFRDATLRDVAFRSLDLSDIVWPTSAEHYIVDDFVPTLDRLLALLAVRTDEDARILRDIVADYRKWAGPRQQRGVIDKFGIRESLGYDGVEEFERLLRQVQTSA